MGAGRTRWQKLGDIEAGLYSFFAVGPEGRHLRGIYFFCVQTPLLHLCLSWAAFGHTGFTHSPMSEKNHVTAFWMNQLDDFISFTEMWWFWFVDIICCACLRTGKAANFWHAGLTFSLLSRRNNSATQPHSSEVLFAFIRLFVFLRSFSNRADSWTVLLVGLKAVDETLAISIPVAPALQGSWPSSSQSSLTNGWEAARLGGGRPAALAKSRRYGRSPGRGVLGLVEVYWAASSHKLFLYWPVPTGTRLM